MSDASREKSREIAVVALVSGGHFWSHFFTLAIPSALPLIRNDFGASNVALGMVMAAFALMSASFQFPMGMFSDRYGARALLIAGLAIESAAVMLQAAAPGVGFMVAVAFAMGIADSVFHPADYTILTAKVRPSWLGKAYAVHTFSGFLGFAAAPTLMSVLLAYGSWREALAWVGAAGLATAIVLAACARLLAGAGQAPQSARAAREGGRGGAFALLLSPPLLAMFVFYTVSTLGSNGIQTFGNSALIALGGLDIVAANAALAAFLWGTASGVLGGGLLADSMKRFDLVATVCYVLAALLLCLIGLGAMPYAATAAALFFAGFMIGAVMPARDLMVRTVTPPGSIGKAFGYVSSGFGVGGFFAPLAYGAVMDLALPQILFYISASMMIATIAVALLASWTARRAGAAVLHPQPAR